MVAPRPRSETVKELLRENLCMLRELSIQYGPPNADPPDKGGHGGRRQLAHLCQRRATRS